MIQGKSLNYQMLLEEQSWKIRTNQRVSLKYFFHKYFSNSIKHLSFVNNPHKKALQSPCVLVFLSRRVKKENKLIKNLLLFEDLAKIYFFFLPVMHQILLREVWKWLILTLTAYSWLVVSFTHVLTVVWAPWPRTSSRTLYKSGKNGVITNLISSKSNP